MIMIKSKRKMSRYGRMNALTVEGVQFAVCLHIVYGQLADLSKEKHTQTAVWDLSSSNNNDDRFYGPLHSPHTGNSFRFRCAATAAPAFWSVVNCCWLDWCFLFWHFGTWGDRFQSMKKPANVFETVWSFGNDIETMPRRRMNATKITSEAQLYNEVENYSSANLFLQ